MLIVSRIDMIFKGLFVIFAIATLGDIPSANKGIRINRSAAHTAPPKNAFKNTFKTSICKLLYINNLQSKR